MPQVAQAQAAQSLNQIVAVVNGEAVTSLEVEQGAKQLLASDDSLSEDAARRLILNDLIDRRLMLQRAELFGIRISDSLVDRRLAELSEEYQLNNEADLRRFAKERYGVSFDDLRDRIFDDLTIQALFYREVYLNTTVNEADLQQFLQVETDIGVKRQYRLGRIVINTDAVNADVDARELAQKIYARAVSGEDFAVLAAEVSDIPDWDLGFRRSDELPRQYAAEAQNLKVGEVGPIVEAPSAYHILKLLDARGGGLRDTVRRVRLGHVFFPTTGAADAAEVARALTDGELTFDEAVKNYSEDPVSVEKAGDLGWFAEEEAPPYFAAAIAEMSEGDISAPIESPFGWHILHLSERQSDKLNMELMRDRASRVLRERNALAQREVWLRALRADSYVRITDPDLLPL